MSKNIDTVTSLLPSLSRSELQQVHQRVSALMSLQGIKGVSAVEVRDEAADQWVDMALQSLIYELQRRGVEFPSAHRLRSSRFFGAYKQKVAEVFKYLRRHFNRTNHYSAMFSEGYRLLYDNLTEMGLPISSTAMMQHTHRIPSLINQAFPGYAEAGLLISVINQKKENRHVRTK